MDERADSHLGAPEPGGVAGAADDDDGRWRTSLAVPVVIAVITIAAIGAIIYLALREQDEGAGALTGTTVEGPLPVTVPYEDVGGAIVIEATFGDGSRTLPVILDTGAPTIVNEDIAATFAGDTIGTISGASADGQVISSEVVGLPRLAVGGAVFRDVGAAVGAIEPGNPFYCLTEAGFVGASLMQAAAWQIDPATGTVTIASSLDDLDVEGAHRLDFTRTSDVSPSPMFELPVGEGRLTFLADSGFDGWLAVNPADVEGLGIEPPAGAPAGVPTTQQLSAGAAGPFITRARWLAAEIELGGVREPVPLAVTEAVPAGQAIAGTDFLRHFVLTIDWATDALYLERLDELAPSAPSSAGMAWDEGYVVGSFVEGLPGNDPLVLGSPVSAIDGLPVEGAPFDDYCTRVVRDGGPAGYELTLAGEPPTTVTVAPVDDFFGPLVP